MKVTVSKIFKPNPAGGDGEPMTASHLVELSGTNCIKIGLPGKLILSKS